MNKLDTALVRISGAKRLMVTFSAEALAKISLAKTAQNLFIRTAGRQNCQL
jgi:hypothetical protein